MVAVDTLYENPTILGVATGHHRIFSQVSYKLVRELQFAPAVLVEAGHLARMFPLCWRKTAAGPVLVALRSLLPDGSGQSPDAPMHESLLPLVLQCFPLVVPGADAIMQQQVLFDSTIADSPTDIGAPLLMGDGRLSRAALDRAKKAISVARALPATEALTTDLAAAGLLEPWPLRFDLGHGHKVAIEDLLVVAASRLRYEEVSTIVSRHGVGVGLFLSLHRASLFRATNLLAAAKQAVAQAPRAHADAAR
jgi:hypothetical protein